MLVVAITFNRWVVLLLSVLLPTVVADDGAKIGSTSTRNDPLLSVLNPSQAIFLKSQDYNNPTNILFTTTIPVYIFISRIYQFSAYFPA
jgi:hypothetical protein